MLLGVIADDFTGASDIANTLTKGVGGQGGLRSALFQGIPALQAAQGIEAGIVALKSRSVPVDQAVAQSLAALEWLLAQGCRQIVFKYCSTFDSTPQGNIGPVAEALAERLGTKAVVVCPAFPEAGRTVYQGHLFVQDRPLHESGMQNHPLNPMTDPDLRRWLQRQCTGKVGHLRWQEVAQGKTRISEALGASDATLIVVDALTVEDLVTIGHASASAPLLTGGSGIASGLPGNFIAADLARGYHADGFQGQSGPAAILAGSCSGATRGQVERHKALHPTLAVNVDSVMDGNFGPEDVVQFVVRHKTDAPLVYSSGSPDQVRGLQDRYGREVVAAHLDALFGQSARRLVEEGISRLVVAGGETSGAVVEALTPGAILIGPEIDPGVPALEVERGLVLALKSGNFGTEDFFEKALERLAGR
ncbi:MAG: four-carbon acid sugar kinase family protein [Rhodobacteraceae bacterium]|nr:four-carbon acid sugar kinase family protein [Paracoccaceae bacterium]